MAHRGGEKTDAMESKRGGHGKERLPHVGLKLPDGGVRRGTAPGSSQARGRHTNTGSVSRKPRLCGSPDAAGD